MPVSRLCCVTQCACFPAEWKRLPAAFRHAPPAAPPIVRLPVVLRAFSPQRRTVPADRCAPSSLGVAGVQRGAPLGPFAGNLRRLQVADQAAGFLGGAMDTVWSPSLSAVSPSRARPYEDGGPLGWVGWNLKDCVKNSQKSPLGKPKNRQVMANCASG